MSTEMKIITEPKVYLIQRPMIHRRTWKGEAITSVPGLDDFLTDEGIENWKEPQGQGAGSVIPEIAGRVCYMSFDTPRPGGNEAYLNHILEVGHGSVLEHTTFGILITNVSRSLTHELVRHRSGFGFSQLSQRYVDESKAEYVCPDIIKEDPALYKIWEETIKASHEGYLKLAEGLSTKLVDKLIPGEKSTSVRKEARQAARSVLPNATETKIFVTMNVRAARHFIEQRGSKFADPEIRKLAYAVYQILVVAAPPLFRDYMWEFESDNTPYNVSTRYRKV